MAGVDLNSRFEHAPAMKDAVKLEQFVMQLRIKIQSNNTKNESNYTTF
jgi:hypothetical protein